MLREGTQDWKTGYRSYGTLLRWPEKLASHKRENQSWLYGLRLRETYMSLDKEIVVHPDLPLPYAHYSSAVRAGEFLFISGQAGIDPQTNKKAGEDFETQARQAFENLKTC